MLFLMVSSLQLKLHLWAGGSPGLQPLWTGENAYDEPESAPRCKCPGYTGTLDCLLQVSGVVRLYTVVSPFWGFLASMLSSDKFLFLEPEEPLVLSLVILWTWSVYRQCTPRFPHKWHSGRSPVSQEYYKTGCNNTAEIVSRCLE